MNAWKLLWELVKHVLHRRGHDEVLVSVDMGDGILVSGEVTGFDWAGDDDAFCVIRVAAGVAEEVYEVLDEVPS
ncbi:hypothetical protein AB0M54_24475 [Actinoplanes sp. NPDC051470]|uniref:hypothetical protein n=1 Tax=Actinoplanes sp. NPDC051470 TaxID=3157224 RepID=UPI0034314D10